MIHQRSMDYVNVLIANTNIESLGELEDVVTWANWAIQQPVELLRGVQPGDDANKFSESGCTTPLRIKQTAMRIKGEL